MNHNGDQTRLDCAMLQKVFPPSKEPSFFVKNSKNGHLSNSKCIFYHTWKRNSKFDREMPDTWGKYNRGVENF